MDLESEGGAASTGPVVPGPKTWSDVRAREVAEVLTAADVRKARTLGRGVVLINLVFVGVLHLLAFHMRAPTGEPDHQTVIAMLAAVAFATLFGIVGYVVGLQGGVPRMPPLPPPPSAGLDRAALDPFLRRDTTSRLQHAGSVCFPMIAGAVADLVFVMQHMPITAPAHLVALAPAAFAVIYLVAAGSDRDRLANRVAREIARVAGRAQG